MQLELLDWRPAGPAPIIPFPMARRIGEAREVAETVAAKITNAQRQACYRKSLANLSARLSRSGLSAVQVDRELDAFTDLVNAQLWRLVGLQGHGGAA